MVTQSSIRVSSHTVEEVNERIRHQVEANLAYLANHPDQIESRLLELDQEWDIERLMATSSSALTLTGIILGATRSRKWLLLSLAVQGFFMQHALEGWCPPLPILRRLGFRTLYEIEQERYALKALRGDFQQAGDADAVLMAARR